MFNNPTATGEYREQNLTNIALRWRNDELIHNQLFTEVKVDLPKFYYWEFDKSHFILPDAFYAPGSNPPQIYSTRRKLAIDMTVPYGLAYPIRDRDAELEREPLKGMAQLKQEAMFHLNERFGLIKEKMARDLFSDTTTVPNSAIAIAWDQANSDPIKDIQTAIKAMQSEIHKTPTHIIIPFDTAIALSSNDSVRDFIKYVNGPELLKSDAGLIIRNGGKFLGLTVLIPKAGMSTQPESDDMFNVNTSYIWDPKQVILFHKSSVNIRGSITFAVNFKYKDKFVWSYRDSLAKTTLYILEEEFKYKLLVPEAGYILTNVLT